MSVQYPMSKPPQEASVIDVVIAVPEGSMDHDPLAWCPGICFSRGRLCK